MTNFVEMLTNGLPQPPETSSQDGETLRELRATKVVTKPWGQERWLVAHETPFAFKVIVLRAGHRTSLQYHCEKEEANLVISGAGRLLVAEKPGLPLETLALTPGSVFHIQPGVVHRVEATIDLVFVEASTPHVDDVVRLEDDSGRGDGRLASEHSSRRSAQ
jgi:mannose-6-phosphate isomerase